jgi:hypothetical protein
MKQSTLEPNRTIDLTGLPEEAVRAVESLVSTLRQQSAASIAVQAPYADWSKALHDWATSHKPVSNPADWSRESIYSGRGE